MSFIMISSRFKKVLLPGLFKSSSFPLPTHGRKGKCGDTPHPVKGLQPLGTLLHSTFEKPFFGCGETKISPDEYDTLNRLDNWQNVTFYSRDDRMSVLVS